ncbi:MAG TPA: hypothetical protein VNJ02_14245 [Vicinamibacterales bacterium]|nr:hypothetical protein [Vicinamibacterales bacterium]
MNAGGGLNGFPRGTEEDRAGRLIVVNTTGHEIAVFQVPALAVVDAEVRGPRSYATDILRPDGIVNGSFLAGDLITVEFSVVAPQASGKVDDVIPSCAAVATDSAAPGDQPVLANGPRLIGWINNPFGAVVGDTQVSAVRSMQVTQDVYRFACQFVAKVQGDIAFDLGASGNGGQTVAVKKAPVAAVGCAECETGLPTVNGAVTNPAPATFYNQEVTFTITAQDRRGTPQQRAEDSRAGFAPSGVQWIFWKWLSGPLAFDDPNFQACPLFPNTTIQCVEQTPPGSPEVAVLTLFAEGYNILEYWAQDAVGNTTARKRASFAFDFEPPYPLFDFPTPTGDRWVDANDVSHGWYNGPVTVPVYLFDNVTPSSQIVVTGGNAGPYTFSQEGPNSPQELTLTDAAGNTRLICDVNGENCVATPYSSADPYFNGRIVHIDSADPTTAASSPSGNVQSETFSLTLSATDRDALGGPGSGVKQTFYTRAHNGVVVDGPFAYTGQVIALNGSGEWVVSAWSTDRAGNTEAPVLLRYYLNTPPGPPLNPPPICGAAYASPGEIWPPNHKQTHNVNVHGVVDPNDNPVSIKITRILQDEPTNTNGDGNTWIDGGGVNASTAWVRAERMGGENGRIYEIFFTATDSKGDSCTGKVVVGVPHDQGHGPAVDSGCRWDSTVKNGPRLSCNTTPAAPVAQNKTATAVTTIGMPGVRN